VKSISVSETSEMTLRNSNHAYHGQLHYESSATLLFRVETKS